MWVPPGASCLPETVFRAMCAVGLGVITTQTRIDCTTAELCASSISQVSVARREHAFAGLE